MDLISFLGYATIGAGLVVVFRNFDERPSQYMAILAIALAALDLLAAARLIPFPSSWSVEIVFPTSIAILALIILVRIAEKSFALLMVFLSGLMILVKTDVIDALG